MIVVPELPCFYCAGPLEASKPPGPEAWEEHIKGHGKPEVPPSPLQQSGHRVLGLEEEELELLRRLVDAVEILAACQLHPAQWKGKLSFIRGEKS